MTELLRLAKTNKVHYWLNVVRDGGCVVTPVYSLYTGDADGDEVVLLGIIEGDSVGLLGGDAVRDAVREAYSGRVIPMASSNEVQQVITWKIHATGIMLQ